LGFTITGKSYFSGYGDGESHSLVVFALCLNHFLDDTTCMYHEIETSTMAASDQETMAIIPSDVPAAIE
jgi:hypothetical protein